VTLRIAWLSPYLPAPENTGGRIRIANLARAFAGDDLRLYLRLAEDDPDASAIRADDYPPWRQIRAVRTRWPRLNLQLTPGLPQSFPPELKRWLAEDDAREPFDAVIAEHCYSAHELPRLERAAVVLSEHNVESDYYLYLAKTRFRKKLRHLWEVARWRRFEAETWRNADAVTMVTERDAQRVRRAGQPHAVVIPNGIALERYRFVPPSRRSGNQILFVGLMSYNPNIEAAKLLAKHVLPRVRKRIRDATLTIGGRDPLRAVTRLESESVRVTGTVPDISKLFDSHAAFANPVSFGGGSSLKVVEALATGLPLVASEFAVRGFGLAPEREYLRADRASELADALIRALSRRGELDPMAERARSIAEKLAWETLRAEFRAVVENAVRRRGGAVR
jgi:glycosyltransferase involved in cell wall biosynthesis